MPEALRPARARGAQAALADEDEKRCACPGVTCVFMNDGREAAGFPSFRIWAGREEKIDVIVFLYDCMGRVPAG